MSAWKIGLLVGFLGIGLGNVRADIPTLKDAYANDFQIGVCISTPVDKAYPPQELDLIARQFNEATPENCMKPDAIEPTENNFTFGEADDFVAFCEQHHMAIHGHTLLWHSQTPNWFFKDGDKPASRDLLLKRLRAHIMAEVGRYKGRVHSWDVVNEVLDDGKLFYRNTKWHKMIGDDFIEQAFRFAHEADPTAELQY
ncbi:MAG TPA: endo-1,4-beta-xylanase, partial [Tepidisphaeraceae bacterium]